MSILLRVKRATWCRIFHHWRKRLLEGYSRSVCSACQNEEWPSPRKDAR